MDLTKYDGKRVRIITPDGETFEGRCSYNNRDFMECEFGFDEDCLQMPWYLFFKRDIRKIEILPDGGPYGGYSGRYGYLEETVVRDGADAIEEVLLSEEDEHTCRLLLCIEDHLALGEAGGLPPKDVLLKILRSVPAPEDEKTAGELRRMTDKLSGNQE